MTVSESCLLSYFNSSYSMSNKHSLCKLIIDFYIVEYLFGLKLLRLNIGLETSVLPLYSLVLRAVRWRFIIFYQLVIAQHFMHCVTSFMSWCITVIFMLAVAVGNVTK